MLDISIPVNIQNETNIQSVLYSKNDLDCEKARKKSEAEGKRVVLLVCNRLGISPQLLMHHSRCRSHIADARQLAMYLLHICTGKSMSEVGRFFGRDRTTVSHACNKIEDKRDDIKFDNFVTGLEDELDLLFHEYAGVGQDNTGVV
jgi:chromosomal replication initiation ATPase DnaA